MNRRFAVLLLAAQPFLAGCTIPVVKLYAATADEAVSGQLRANAATLPGDTFDLEDDLGFGGEKHPFEASLSVAKRHRLWGLGYGRRSYRSSEELAETGAFAGGLFDAGNTVETCVSMTDYRGYVGARAVNRKAFCFARVGLVGADWAVTLKDSDGDGAEVSHVTVFPVAGAGFQVKLGPFASLRAEVDAMDMELGDIRANFVEWRTGVEIVLVQGITLELGYQSHSSIYQTEHDRLSLDLDGPSVAFLATLAIR